MVASSASMRRSATHRAALELMQQHHGHRGYLDRCIGFAEQMLGMNSRRPTAA
jgi:hypothetical protein